MVWVGFEPSVPGLLLDYRLLKSNFSAITGGEGINSLSATAGAHWLLVIPL